jgi:hypothetical protein
MKNEKKLWAIFKVAFDGGDIRDSVESYGPEFWEDMIAYCEAGYQSGHSMRFTIAKDCVRSFFKKEKTRTAVVIGYDVVGMARINLWGGGAGDIEMSRTRIEPGHVTKDNVLRCVNDGGFGCESIQSACVYVVERLDDGGFGKEIEIEADSDYSRSLFLGWQHLQKIGAVK